jgi:hypothetical protein
VLDIVGVGNRVALVSAATITGQGCHDGSISTFDRTELHGFRQFGETRVRDGGSRGGHFA